MTVSEVWGTIDGGDVLPLSHSGDEWYFPFPEGATGRLVVEFWAMDEAGNTAYRAAIVQLYKGTIKCWRWRDVGCDSTMLALHRPDPDLGIGRPTAEASDIVRGCTPAWARPACEALAHACPAIGG